MLHPKVFDSNVKNNLLKNFNEYKELNPDFVEILDKYYSDNDRLAHTIWDEWSSTKRFLYKVMHTFPFSIITTIQAFLYFKSLKTKYYAFYLEENPETSVIVYMDNGTQKTLDKIY